MRLANEDPTPSLKEKIRELYRTSRFFLDKEEPINLRLKNFYFKDNIRSTDSLKIYKMIETEPEPETDQVYWEGKYMPKKTVEFSYNSAVEEKYYAVDQRTGKVSNCLSFIWE